MNRDLTVEELYERFVRDVLAYLEETYGLARESACCRVRESGLRDYFLRDPEMFEFMDARKVAKIVIVAGRLVDREL